MSHVGKNSRGVRHNKVKVDLLREIHTPRQGAGRSGSPRAWGPPGE